MLYLDGISISKIKNELILSLKNKKVNKITQKNDFAFSVHFGRDELIFSCVSNLAICYLGFEKERAIIDISSSFITALRTRLLNSVLVDITQLGFDRILVFHFSRLNELGEIKNFKLIFEMFSSSSNVILTEEDKIIEVFRKVSISKDRVIFYGAKYEDPKSEKVHPLSIDEEQFSKYYIEKKLTEKIEGLGKLLAKNLKSLSDLKKILKDESKSKIFFSDKKIVLATLLDIEIENYDEIKYFNSYNEMINFYIDYVKSSSSFGLLKNGLLSKIKKQLKKVLKTANNIKFDMEKEEKIPRLKEEADILASNLHNIKKGDAKSICYDFYQDKMIEITLDPLLEPNKNLEKKYKEYNKMKNKVSNARRRLEEVEEELKYLSSVEHFIESSEELENLKNIEEELISYGYIKQSYKTKKNKIKKEVKFGIYNFNGINIFYGRNNIENDFITMKYAGRNDLWFHAKDIAGSHVILREADINEENINMAIRLACYYSKAKIGDRVTVDYCRKKYINKPRSAKPAFVNYTNFKSVNLIKEDINN